MNDYKFDDTFMNILREEGQIIPFLNSLFGFLHRRTDFYMVKSNPDATVGFPPGFAEQAVRGAFRKWQKMSEDARNSSMSSMNEDFTDLVIHEEEVVTTDSCDVEESSSEISTQQPASTKREREDDISSDIYNGADCGLYRWSQTNSEVDIKIPVPGCVTKASSVRVDLQACRLTVRVRGPDQEWETRVDGEISHKHLKDESLWTLTPGRQINVHLQKADEKWWDSLLASETKIDLNRLDVSRHVTELPDEDKMQVEKVMLQEERKRHGLPSLEHQERLDTLRKAWDQEGSPFKGTPFDPSVLQLQ